MRPSPITPTIDLESDGVRHGYLRLPNPSETSAWGSVMIPFAVARNGIGPTALITGGNHGDEYEGPLALLKLAARVDVTEVRGRIIIVPAMNYPAFRAGRRTSPLDNGDLNRRFPGNPSGSATDKIADYFQRELLPRADVVLDMHSGGRTMEFVPFAAAHELSDKELEARCVAGMRAFGAPYSVIMREMDPADLYDTAAEEMGKVFVTTELGGGGTATARTVALTERGVVNLLRHFGILAGDPVEFETRVLTMPDDCFIISEHAGLLDPCVDLGEGVEDGSLVARIMDPTRTAGAVAEYRSPRAGLLAGRHFPSLVQSGDCLAVIAVPD